jgi:hypothetical protein
VEEEHREYRLASGIVGPPDAATQLAVAVWARPRDELRSSLHRARTFSMMLVTVVYPA